MSRLGLPAFSPDAAPEFVDAQSAKAWLENLPLTNVAASQQRLLAQLREFNRSAISPPNRLGALEALREALHFVQIERARRFVNRALPMAQAEAAAFDDTVALWSEMRLGYQHCLQAALDGVAGMGAQAGRICQRSLAYSGLKMFHHHRAYRQLLAEHWRELHQGYALAEELGVAEVAVKDYLNRDVTDTSPRIAYLRAVLMAAASPNELGQRQLTFVAYLLERWAHKVEVCSQAPEGESAEPLPLWVDLAGERGPALENRQGAAPRYLDVRRLAKSLRNRIGLLRKGESPAKLALGEDCVQPACAQLLVLLYRRWCQAQPARAAAREPAALEAQACGGIEAIHHHLSGQPFKQPGETKEITAAQRDQIVAFGRLSTRADEASAIVLERWQLENESAEGLKILRPAGESGRRYVHGQLVGLRIVRVADPGRYLLGQLRWLAQTEAGGLCAGVRLLPGLPVAAAVRPTGVNVMAAKYAPAIALASPATSTAPRPSLVLPAGWFKPGAVLEIYLDGPAKVRLTGIVDRGSDYECCAYERMV